MRWLDSSKWVVNIHKQVHTVAFASFANLWMWRLRCSMFDKRTLVGSWILTILVVCKFFIMNWCGPASARNRVKDGGAALCSVTWQCSWTSLVPLSLTVSKSISGVSGVQTLRTYCCFKGVKSKQSWEGLGSVFFFVCCNVNSSCPRTN